MFASLTSRLICPFCEFATFTPLRLHASIRHGSTLQKRKPSRMVLADSVGRPSRDAYAAQGRTIRKSKNSPFGGMNRTILPRELREPLLTSSRAHDRISTSRRSSKPEKSRDPMKALKMQRRLASVSYDSRTRIKKELDQWDSFDEFELLPVVRQAVMSQTFEGMTDVVPTPVQRLAIPVLLDQTGKKRKKKPSDELGIDSRGMEQYLLAAETGSGKTLAYVLPLVDVVKRAELAELEQQRLNGIEKSRLDQQKRGAELYELDTPDLADKDAARPRAIILVPTAELVAQVGSVLKNLSHIIKFRTALISAAYTPTVIRSRLYSGKVDIVVATPHLLGSIANSDPNILSRTSHLVIDEADSLLDRSFTQTTSDIIDRATPSLEKLIMCSATIPKSLNAYLNKRYPFTRRLATPNLHAIPRRVTLSTVDIEQIPYQGNRDLACAQVIWDIGKQIEEFENREKKIVVFVNEREESMRLAKYLQSRGIDAIALSRDSDDRQQAEVLTSFTSLTPQPSTSGPVQQANSDERNRRQLANVKVLVMTDIGSRGIDTVAVRDVILYNVPYTSVDFIHRLGRLGRMGRRGRGIVLVGRNDRKDIVREVRDGMHRGQALI